MGNSETWNDKVTAISNQWLTEGMSYNQQAKRMGIHDTTWYDWRKRRVTDISKTSKQNRARAYAGTGIEAFKFDGYEKFLPKPEAKSDDAAYQQGGEWYKQLSAKIKDARKAGISLEKQAKKSGIPQTTLHGYYKESVKELGNVWPATREKLWRYYKVDAVKPVALAESSKPSAEARLASAAKLFYTLAQGLESFRREYPDEYMRLRDVIPGPDVGRVGDLLEVIFKTDPRRQHIIRSDYRYEGPLKRDKK